MGELLMGIVEAIVALVGSIIEAIVGIFLGAGEAMGAGEAILVFILLLFELALWLFLTIIELVKSLFQRRRPQKVKKPIIWRKQKQEVEQIDKLS